MKWSIHGGEMVNTQFETHCAKYGMLLVNKDTVVIVKGE